MMRMLPFAQRLQSIGCLVTFLVADTRIAEEVLSPFGFAFEKTFTRYHQSERRAPNCYSDILRWAGFNTAQLLLHTVEQYVSYFAKHEVNVIVGDYSPNAAIAAKVAGIDFFVVGNGFEIPPDTIPTQSIRPWENVSDQEIYTSDVTVLRSINEVFRMYHIAPITLVSEIYDSDKAFLTVYPELDHYAVRSNGKYIGLTAAQVLNEQSIPVELNPDIFAYLSNDSLSNDSIVEALGREKRKSLFISRGYKRAVPENVYHSHRIIKYSDFIYGVSVMITNANVGTVISGLLHGIPQVLIPRTVEQTLFATRVVEMGAGIMLRGVVIPSDVTAAIRVITTNPIYRDSARSFAGSYANAAVIECGHSHGVVGGIVQRIVSAGLKMKLKKE